MYKIFFVIETETVIEIKRQLSTSPNYFSTVWLAWCARQLLRKRTSRQSDYHSTHINFFANVLYGSLIIIVRPSAISQTYFTAVWLSWNAHQLLRKRTSRQTDCHGTHISNFVSVLHDSLIIMVCTSATSQAYITTIRLLWYAHQLLRKRT